MIDAGMTNLIASILEGDCAASVAQAKQLDRIGVDSGPILNWRSGTAPRCG
jgi:hypothetical protein